VPRRRERLLVLGLVGQYPVAGVAWQAIHYLVGLERLGWEVYYVEDSGAAPYDPRSGGRTDDCSYACQYIADMMRRIGLADRWATLDMARGQTYGPAGPRLVYRGRIDDRAVDFGRARPQPQVRDLADVLETLTSGHALTLRTTTAVGCFITEPR